jgi:phosphodiesterase/alkaline phosphatase D-like protein
MARCNSALDSTVTFSYGLASGGARQTVVATVTSSTDFTTKARITGLTSNSRYTYDARCVDAVSTKTSTLASFKTVPAAEAAVDLTFVWAADLAGQGWGRWPGLRVRNINNTDIVGGYPVFQTMQSFNPDFALFQGDMIYADNACPESLVMPEEVGGSVWYNVSCNCCSCHNLCCYVIRKRLIVRMMIEFRYFNFYFVKMYALF